jgi:ABC-type transport system involved in cytochrome bd biosynthesis fused ATPase/permease subunit
VLRGASGTGKTTCAMGILGLIRYSGSLTINGVEVSNINNLSELASGALQNGHIFNTSLRENLKISGAEDFTEVLQLLELNLISCRATRWVRHHHRRIWQRVIRRRGKTSSSC